MKFVLLCAFLLVITCYHGENFGVEASGTIKKIVRRKSKTDGFEIAEESNELSFPKEGRCEAIGKLRKRNYNIDLSFCLGDYIASRKKIYKHLEKFIRCLIEKKSARYGSLHDKYTAISKECARFGHRAVSNTHIQSLSCIFCYKEIQNSIRARHSEISQIIVSEDDESIVNLYIIVIYMERFLRSRLSAVSRSVVTVDWFKAYSSSRELCGYITLVFEYWNRVVRDAYWPYLIFVSDNYYSRFPVEYRKLITFNIINYYH